MYDKNFNNEPHLEVSLQTVVEPPEEQVVVILLHVDQMLLILLFDRHSLGQNM